ncbi:MAG TPA: hypothetical protein VJ761_03550 [Ktedonobacteraceae bacterium]|nr:hypothetical protein [Ktedonobacteraceae bacterium]
MISPEEKTEEKASLIIHSNAIASTIGANAFAGMSWFGLDASLSATIGTNMVRDLGKLFGKTYKETTIHAILDQVLGTIMGVSSAASVLGLVPGIGNAVNSSITFSVIEILGWAVYDILKDGRDITSLSLEEFKKYIRIASTAEKPDMRKRIEALSPEKKREYNRLIAQLGDEDLSDEERQSILNKLENLMDSPESGVPRMVRSTFPL